MDINSEEIEQQIAVINNSVELFKTGPQILLSNCARASKALEIGKSVLLQIETEGMTEEIDARAMNYLSNIGKALPEIKDARAPITQVMTSLAKMFTEIENELDPKKEKTIAWNIQQHRNAWAKKLAEEQRQREIDAENKRRKETEAIELKAFLRTQVFNEYNRYLLHVKQKMQSALNNCTLDNIDSTLQIFKEYSPSLSREKYNGMELQTPLVMKYHSIDDLMVFAEIIKEERYAELSNNYLAEMTSKRDELIELIPSKRIELQEIENLRIEAEKKKKLADEQRLKDEAELKKIKDKEAQDKAKKELEEKQRKEAADLQKLKDEQEQLLNQQKEREQEADKLLNDEAQENLAADIEKTEVAAEGDKTLAMFQEQEAIVATTQAPASRLGYEIIILHQAAYGAIFQLWFTNEGAKMPLDKLDKYSLGQMKAWCEKHAHKTSEKIESKFLKYEPTYKAVNTKAKTK